MKPGQNRSSKTSGKKRKRRILIREELELAVSNSSSVYDVCRILRVSNSGVYRAMERFGIEKPRIWYVNHVNRMGRLRRQNLSTIISSEIDCNYIATIIGTEGAITVGYDVETKKTRLKIIVGMTDRPWVAKFAEICGLGPPLHIPTKKKAIGTFGRRQSAD